MGAGFKLCARGGNGVPIVTPCHSLGLMRRIALAVSAMNQLDRVWILGLEFSGVAIAIDFDEGSSGRAGGR